jgi:hypothetical protein
MYMAGRRKPCLIQHAKAVSLLSKAFLALYWLKYLYHLSREMKTIVGKKK